MGTFIIIGLAALILFSLSENSPLPPVSIDPTSIRGQSSPDISPGFKQTGDGSIIPAGESGYSQTIT